MRDIAGGTRHEFFAKKLDFSGAWYIILNSVLSFFKRYLEREHIAMKNHRLGALMLSLVLALTMCFGGMESVFAEEVDDEPTDTPSVQLVPVESEDSTSSCYEVVVSERGYLEISFPAGEEDVELSYDTKLLNYEKESLVGDDWQTITAEMDYTACYGVSAGTYYLVVKDGILGDELPTAVFEQIDNESGSTKAKAVSIFKGRAEKEGVVTAKQKVGTCQWYKFRVNKAQKVSIRLSGKTNGKGLKFTVVSKNGSSVVRTIDSENAVRNVSLYSIVNKKEQKVLSPGTYWIRVQKLDEASSGYYSIKWK